MKLLKAPDSSSYGVQFGKEVERAQLDGGAGRYRKDIFNASFMIPVIWICDPEEYTYLMAFYRTATKRGSLSFTVDLIIDSSELTEYEVHIVPETFGLTSQRGHTYIVGATLEAKQPVNPSETGDDNDIIDAYEEAHT